MSICSFFFLLFSSFAIVSSLFVIFAKNPVFSVLFLILSFFNVASLLFFFQFEFLPISCLVIYVGAIAVLLLFVLIMLNLKLSELVDNKLYFAPFSLFFILFFFFELFYLFRSNFIFLEIFQKKSDLFLCDYFNIFSSNFKFFYFFQSISNIQAVSLALFSDYLFCFLISGFLLFLAMVGAITLTLKKHWTNKTQNIYFQLNKNTQKSLTSL